MTRKIAITTPTGNTGRALTARLLDANENKQLEIVLLARDPFIVYRGQKVQSSILAHRAARVIQARERLIKPLSLRLSR